MGLFDSFSGFVPSLAGGFLSGIIGGPTGAIVGAGVAQGLSRPVESGQRQAATITPAAEMILTTPQPTRAGVIGANVGVDVYQPKQTQETKQSGEKVMTMYENGPMQAGAVGALVPFAQQLGRTIFGTGTGSAIVGGVGGALLQQGVQQYMGAGDACGCSPKPFVRLDKCGRPIITRAMQAKAKDMVMCMGIENAAAALGISVPLLAEIAFKKFKPRARGISGAQLKTARRVNNRVMKMAKDLKKACR